MYYQCGASLYLLPEQRVRKYPERAGAMGKGDRRTKRGKLFRGTFGKRRVRASNQKKKGTQPGGPAA
jgi:ribosomal small subunit protein bTHX